jgi:hypothetical protein
VAITVDPVFEGGAYGVGVTVTSLEPVPWPDVPLPPGMEVHPARLGEMMPVVARTQAERAAELERVNRVEAQLAAYKAELVAGMAAESSHTADRRPGMPGAAATDPAVSPADDRLPGVSEFFPDELAMILSCSRPAATTLTEHSLTLVERLPATWAALADGRLDWPRARALARELGWPARETDPEVVAEVEAAVLPDAMNLSVSRLVAAIRRELLIRDASAADRRRTQAERAADVTVHPLGDGMAELRAVLPLPLAAATRQTVDAYARMAKEDGDVRLLGQLRVGVLSDLVLRPWDTSRPAVTAALTVVAPVGGLRTGTTPGSAGPDALPDRVAEVGGQPITAAHLRELLQELGSLCPGGLEAPAGGSLDVAIVDPATGGQRAVVTPTQLARLVRRGCPDHPTGGCGCAVLGPPTPVDRYRPTPDQYRFVRTRDRTCRHPGCANQAAWADLDHVVPHAGGGPTDCANLCCLCRRHHRLKTHGHSWRFVMDADGVLSVTTPSGITRTTRPPGLDPPAALRPVPATLAPDDDPPPF